MLLETSNTTLKGLKGLVVGIANQHSIAWGCAEAFRAAGAELPGAAKHCCCQRADRDRAVQRGQPDLAEECGPAVAAPR